jgi:hypothetical protein
MDTEQKSDLYQPIENPESNPNIINLRDTPGFLAFIQNIEISINEGNLANIVKGDRTNLDTELVQPDDSSDGIHVLETVAEQGPPYYFEKREGEKKVKQRKVKLRKDSIDKLLYVYCVLFRIMIYYDQSHDISEADPRNKLFKNINKKTTTVDEESGDSDEGSETNLSKKDDETRTIILQYLYQIMIDDVKEFILKDKPGIFNGGRDDRDGSEILIKDFEKNTYETLENFLKETVSPTNGNEDKRQKASEKLIEFYFKIQANNIGNTLKSKDIPYDCNHNYKTLLSTVNYTKNTLIKDIYPDIVREDGNIIDNTKNKIIATVDADKSKFNVSSIASVICALNVVNMSQDDDRLTFLSDPASEFDSAGTSSVETLVTRLLGKKGGFSTLSNFKVMLNETCIIEFKYQKDNDYIIPIYINLVSLKKIKNIYSLINGKSSTLSQEEKIYAQQQLKAAGIQNNQFKSDQKVEYINKYDKFFQKLQKDKKKELIKKLSIQSDVKKLIVQKFFKLEPKDGEQPFTRNGKKSSVNEITTDIVKNLTNQGKGDFNRLGKPDSKFYKMASDGNYGEVSASNWLREFNKFIIFKELGDLGQILSTYCLQLHKRFPPNESRIDQTIYFITFDKLAGKMSSLFNYGTVFEANEHDSKYNASFPLEVFVYKDLADYQDILDPVKILLSLQGKSIEDSEVLDDADHADDADVDADDADVDADDADVEADDFILEGLSEGIDGDIDGEEYRDSEQLPDHEESLEELGEEESGQVHSDDAEITDAEITDAQITDAKPPDAPITDAKPPDAPITDAQMRDVKQPGKRSRNDDSEVPLGPRRTKSKNGGKKNKKKTKKKKNKKN